MKQSQLGRQYGNTNHGVLSPGIQNYPGLSLKNEFVQKKLLIYRISANGFRGNYSFLILTLCTVTFGDSTYRCGNYSREETIQGRKLFAEIRYIKFQQKRFVIEKQWVVRYNYQKRQYSGTRHNTFSKDIFLEGRKKKRSEIKQFH